MTFPLTSSPRRAPSGAAATGRAPLSARAHMGRRRGPLALAWIACLLTSACALPLSVPLASALVLAGRLLGAADPVSSERCRRAMVAAGGVATSALALCAAARALGLQLPSALAVALSTVSLIGLICLAVGAGVPERELFSVSGVAVLACALLPAPSPAVALASLSLATCAVVAVLAVRALSSRGGKPADASAPLASLAARPLSPREAEVLERTLAGETRPQIARALGVSESTVGTLRSRGYEKLGVGSKDELEALAKGAGGARGEKDDRAGETRARRLAEALAAATPPCASLVTLLAPSSLSSACVVAGALLVSVSLSCFVLLGADTGGAHALGERLGTSPSWDKGLVTALVAPLVPALVVSTWPRRLAGALLVVAALALLGADIARREPGDAPASRARRVLRAGSQELACRAPEASGLMGLALIALSQDAVARVLLPEPGPLDGAWLLVAALAALAFGRAFGPEPGDAPRHDALAREILSERGLSETQAEVALCLAGGMGEPEVCERLHLARGTVKSYRSRVYRALGVHSAAELREALRIPPRA